MDSPPTVSRRGLLMAGAAVPVAAVPVAAIGGTTDDGLRELEITYRARLGVYARNVRTGRVVTHRADERFAMLSTFKTVAAAAVLRQRHDLDEMVHYPPEDVLLPNSPITAQHVGTGLALGEVCAAAIRYSDNAAGNLMLRRIGGPGGLTRFFRSIGDRTSRLDRWEVALNSAVPGDPRDTTTPAAIARAYEELTLGRHRSRQLVTWLKGNTTSAARFRAGLPDDWVIGDKTGTGDYGSAHDVGVAWTTRGTPLVLAVLSSKTTQDAPVDNALIADAARYLARTLAPKE